jgi:RNA polymerase sigma-70 factor, ECF subfamily
MSVRSIDLADGALVRGHLQGDEGESFAVLYRRFFPRLVRMCERRTGDRSIAEDIAQETLIRAHANLEGFDANRPMWPWLKTIATRLVIDHARERAREVLGDPADRPTDCDDERWRVERAVLSQALSRLPRQQHIAMQLRYLDDWTPSEVAAFLGVSRSAVEQLFFRARRKFRHEYRKASRGAFGFLLLPAGAIRRRLHRIAERNRSWIGFSSEPLLGGASNSIATGVAALVVTLATLVPSGTAATFASGGATGSSTNVSSTPPAGRAMVALAPSLVRRVARTSSLADSLLHPTKNATPEDTQFNSIAQSPNYEQDHTLIAAGSVPCAQATCPVLFTSRDGGATWNRMATQNFQGSSVLLPPGYPADRRIFAMGPTGLQISTDAGASFDRPLPLQGDVAISPLFESNDPRILIGTSALTEYRADLDIVKPATLIGPAGAWLTVSFSPDFASDRMIFVGGIRPDATGAMRPTVNRCVDYVCDNVVFADGFDAPWVRLSPAFRRDSRVYAFTTRVLFLSTDRGTSYKSSMPWSDPNASIGDVLVASDGTAYAAIYSLRGKTGDVYRTSDDGATWTRSRVHLSGFDQGATHITMTPDGRLLALGVSSGIACSADHGRTWASRCTPAS